MKIIFSLAVGCAVLLSVVEAPAQKAPDFTRPATASARSRAARGNSGGPQWIWAAEQVGRPIPAGACFFRKAFDLKNPDEGTIAITCDDRYELYVNGRKVGAGTDWHVLDQYDITPYLVSGRNMVAVRAENVTPGSAGLMARVTVKRAGETEISHSTNSTWKTSLRDEANWQNTLFNDARWAAAHSFGEFGRTAPWGEEVRSDNGASGGRFQAPKQFRVERIVDPEDTGSLIAMTFNEWGEIVASREGEGLILIRDGDNDGTPDTTTVYCAELKNCQGLLALNGSIFATADGPEGLGLYRATDDDQDGDIDTIKRLVAFKGNAGEHGPHGLVLGPDGLIYVIVGNFSGVETNVLPTSPLRSYYEGDLLQPRYEDAGGHDVGIKAPGGTVVRTDLEGSFVELFACGLRNCYDLAFNRQGELFTYDSDMEWDIGLPWYRPTRINHVVPGSESGWRSGWAKWPDYYLDSLPAMMDIGRGSPTGVVFYNHTRYPQRYHNALFACDWSQGRILALTLQSDGGTYVCGGEVFLQGRPLNVTDVAVGADGWLYFATGGRDTEGGIYRVVWSGKTPPEEHAEGILEAIRQPQLEAAWARERVATIKEEMGVEWEPDLIKAAKNVTLPNQDRVRALELMQLLGPSPAPALLQKLAEDSSVEVRAKAVELMGLHANAAGNKQLIALLTDPDASVRRRACEALVRAGHQAPTDKLVALLGDQDRFVAWAARRAIEAAPSDQWKNLVLAAKDHSVFLNGAVALMTVSPNRDDAQAILTRCGRLMTGFLTDDDFLDLLRVIQLTLLRGEIQGEDIPKLRGQLAEEYPSLEPRINRELVTLLVYLRDESVTDRLVEELKGKSALVERIHLATCARYCNTNWTTEQKLDLLRFYEQARLQEGGYSYALYLANFIRDYVAEFDEAERQQVLANALKMPAAALGAVMRLPEGLDRRTLDALIRLDRRLKSLDDPAAKELGVGILAILGRERDAEGMAYMREVFENQPERRPIVAMSLAQEPAGENWPLLVRSLPVLEGFGVQEVIVNLLKVDQVPDKPEPIRQVILCGLKMQGEGSEQAIELLEKWTEVRASEPGDDWQTALAAWQQWFIQEYPDQPEPVLPSESTESRWTSAEILEHLRGAGESAGDPVRGHLVFEKAQCVKCHRFGNRGEGMGPDLTTVSSRFHTKEIVESVLFPSHVISDQYATKIVETTDGQILTGLVAQSGQDAVLVLQANGQKTLVPLAKIENIGPAQKSAMPEGLFNNLSLEEIADLFAYLQTASPETARATSEQKKQ